MEKLLKLTGMPCTESTRPTNSKQKGLSAFCFVRIPFFAIRVNRMLGKHSNIMG